MNDELLHNYFDSLVNRFFKILPMREQGEEFLDVYMQSFRNELIGCDSLLADVGIDANIITLASILQFLIDNPDEPVGNVKREVFRAISICNKLKEKYSYKGVQI